MDRRAYAGLVVALAAVMLAAPSTLVPWGAAVHEAPAGWAAGLAPHSAARRAAETIAPFALPLMVCSLLVVAGSLLPRAPRPLLRRPELLPLGLGWLLLLEPPLHLALLALVVWHAPPGMGDLLLPRVPTGAHAAGAQIAVLSLAVPVAEEFFFRGRLVPWLQQRLGSGSAVTLSALAFACAHGDPAQALVALPLGLLLGALRVRGAALAVCVVVHQVHNGLFLVGGPAVVSAPWTGLVLSGAGLVCIALGAGWPGRPMPRDPRGLWLTCLLGAAVITAGYPSYRRVQDRLWVAAMHRVIVSGPLQDDILTARVDWQCARGRIDLSRRLALAGRLRLEPSLSHERQLWVVARLDPSGCFAVDDTEATDIFETLARCPQDYSAHAEAARRVAIAHPHAFADFTTRDPEAVARWLPLPAQAAAVAAQIDASRSGDRMHLLAGLERACPGAIADALLRVPPERVTPIDRRFLYEHYPDARERLAGAPPAVARAFAPDPYGSE
jgi:membrane protease YdiL (CAAX protease family)